MNEVLVDEIGELTVDVIIPETIEKDETTKTSAKIITWIGMVVSALVCCFGVYKNGLEMIMSFKGQ